MIVSSRSPASAAISLYGFFHKYRCALTRGRVDIFCKLPAAGMHVSQFAQNLVRALIKVFCHEVLQLYDQCPGGVFLQPLLSNAEKFECFAPDTCSAKAIRFSKWSFFSFSSVICWSNALFLS